MQSQGDTTEKGCSQTETSTGRLKMAGQSPTNFNAKWEQSFNCTVAAIIFCIFLFFTFPSPSPDASCSKGRFGPWLGARRNISRENQLVEDLITNNYT